MCQIVVCIVYDKCILSSENEAKLPFLFEELRLQVYFIILINLC